MNILIIIAGVICLAALIVTIAIGLKPEDKTYQKNTKSRLTLLTVIYIVTFVPAFIFTILYYVYR